jgi:mannose-6-phosphate isomerase-like protein (cupin superfamily)
VGTGAGRRLYRFEDLPWLHAQNVGRDEQRDGMRGKRPVWGDGGFFLQHVEMEPGYEVKAHSHSHAELLVVLEGGARFDDGTTVTANDTAVIDADTVYGFTVGPDGIRFLIVRGADAVNTRAGA